MARSRTVLPLYAASHGPLVLSVAPTPGLVGQRLQDAGALGPGTYECEIATDGCNVIEVDIKPSALTGAITMYLRAMHWYQAASFRATGAEDTSVLAAGTADTLVLTDLRGRGICKVMFTVDTAESVNFAPGANPAAPTGIASFNTL